jgi:hypothetical protein
MSNLTNIVIGLIVVGLLLVRQLQARPAKETSSIRIVLILGLIGIFEMKGAIGSHRVTAAPIAWLVLSLLAGAGMGAVRGATVRIWRAEDGSAGGRERCSRLRWDRLTGHPPRPGRGHRPLHHHHRPRDLQHPGLPDRDPRRAAGDRALAGVTTCPGDGSVCRTIYQAPAPSGIAGLGAEKT